MDIKAVKEEISFDLAEYAVANQIADETEFSWWVPYTRKKMNRNHNELLENNCQVLSEADKECYRKNAD